MGIRRGAVALVSVVVAISLGASPASPASAGNGGLYRPPVDAPVVDPFREPASRFGPGNRGLTYDLAASTPVRTSAPGEVTWAGPVAGTLHVTVLHDDGLRTSYSFLESIDVRRGTRVDVGQQIGTGGSGFHFGVRDGDVYLDPALLFGVVEIRVRLVPHDEALPPTDEGLLRERIALTEVVRSRGLLDRLVEGGKSLLSAEIAGLHVLSERSPTKIVTGAIGSLWDRANEECTANSTDVPAEPGAGHVGLLVAGHGSSSGPSGVDDVDTAALGYGPDDVLRYSYAGGRIPDADLSADLASIPAYPYAAPATRSDLFAEGAALADLIEEVAIARPGVPIDVIAHSQGGIVTRIALAELEDRGRLDLVGTVVTIGTPHRGTDLATAATLLRPQRHQSIEMVADWVGHDLESDAESVLQMSEFSELIAGLDRDGIPDAVRFRTIGAAGDPVVTGEKTTIDGVPSAMVSLYGPWAHGRLPGDPGTTREIGLALAGLAPRCRDLGESLLDAVLPEIVSWGENTALAGLMF